MPVGFTATSYAGDTGVPSTSGAVGDSNDGGSIPYGARYVTVLVNFGVSGGANNARTTVTGVPWVKNTPRPSAHVVGRPAPVSGAGSDEDAISGQLRAVVTAITDGTSFDVIAFAPEGANGQFLVQVIGVGA